MKPVLPDSKILKKAPKGGYVYRPADKGLGVKKTDRCLAMIDTLDDKGVVELLEAALAPTQAWVNSSDLRDYSDFDIRDNTAKRLCCAQHAIIEDDDAQNFYLCDGGVFAL